MRLNLSLRARSLLLTLVALLIFLPSVLFTLERAYVSSLEQAKYNELKLMSLAMITEFELDSDATIMPQQLFEEQLNLPGSGYMAYIIWNNRVVWRSLSSLDYRDPTTVDTPAVGSEEFTTYALTRITEPMPVTQPPFYYAFSAEYENNGNFDPVTFLVFNEQFEFQQERRVFLKTLWQWLGVLSIGLLALIVFITQRVLAPVNSIISNVEAAEKGNISRLTDTYPPELESLKNSINQLLESEAQQRERYKNSLGDLAHSVKTPLAVLLGDEKLAPSSHEPLLQIDNIIKRQLKRTISNSHGRFSAIDLNIIVNKLIGAMHKVYADKSLVIDNSLQGNINYKGDETDLMELLGNIIDNACKSAKQHVNVSANIFDHSLHICIEDDGDGIDLKRADEILRRGKRLDTYKDGQGIGLAVVMDLLESYDGQLHIDKSAMGGAQFNIRLPV